MDIWEVNKKSPRQMGMATYSNICLHKLSHAYMVYLYLSKYLFKYDFARKILMTHKIQIYAIVRKRRIKYSSVKCCNISFQVCAFQ